MLVSFYNHCSNLKYYFYSDTFENFLRIHLEEPCYGQYGSYFKFERDMWEAFQPHVETGAVLNVTFENLKLNAAVTMKKIGQHLGMGYDDEFYEKVLHRRLLETNAFSFHGMYLKSENLK